MLSALLRHTEGVANMPGKGALAFAIKRDGELVKQIHAPGKARRQSLNETVADLPGKGLANKG